MIYQALQLAIGFHMEIRRLTKNVYEILGTEFSMETRMPTQNMHDILGTEIEHWIQYGG